MREAVRFGWVTTKDHFLFFVGILLAAFLIVIVPEGIGKALSGLADEQAPGLGLAFKGIGLLFSLLSSVLYLILQMGFIRISLNFHDGSPSGFADLFSSWRLFFKYLLGAILYGLRCFWPVFLLGIVAAILIPSLKAQAAPSTTLAAAITLGVLFLILLPLTVIWAIKYQFFGYLVVDRGLGPVEAIRKSADVTDGAKVDLFLFCLLIVGINLLGMLALMVGLFVTLPLSVIAYAHVYRRPSGEAPVVQRLEDAEAEPDAVVPLDIDLGGGESPVPAAVMKPSVRIVSKTAPASAGEETRTKGLFLLFYRNDYEGAIQEFTRAIGQDARYAGAYFSRGMAYFKLGEFNLALKDFNEAIDLNRDYAEEAGVFVQRGLAREKLGDRSGAVQDLRAAVALGNRDAQRWLNWIMEQGEDL
jgi:tetratricopeptide (TPR) repeat protein